MNTHSVVPFQDESVLSKGIDVAMDFESVAASLKAQHVFAPALAALVEEAPKK